MRGEKPKLETPPGSLRSGVARLACGCWIRLGLDYPTIVECSLHGAARDLLETLKYLARGNHEWSVREEARQFMERAIAKAENR